MDDWGRRESAKIKNEYTENKVTNQVASALEGVLFE